MQSATITAHISAMKPSLSGRWRFIKKKKKRDVERRKEIIETGPSLVGHEQKSIASTIFVLSSLHALSILLYLQYAEGQDTRERA